MKTCLDAASSKPVRFTRREGLAVAGAALTSLAIAEAPASAAAKADTATSTGIAEARRIGTLELVGTVEANYPAGIAVSREGRIFVSCPNQDGDVLFTLYEMRDGGVVPWPDEKRSRPDPDRAESGGLVSVQALWGDASDDRPGCNPSRNIVGRDRNCARRLHDRLILCFIRSAM